MPDCWISKENLLHLLYFQGALMCVWYYVVSAVLWSQVLVIYSVFFLQGSLVSREASFKEKVRSSEHSVCQALVDRYFVLPHTCTKTWFLSVTFCFLFITLCNPMACYLEKRMTMMWIFFYSFESINSTTISRNYIFSVETISVNYHLFLNNSHNHIFLLQRTQCL